MNDEEGLQGSWFMGTITQLQHGFVLVAYDELMVSEDSDEKLQEWFPLSGTPQSNKDLLESTYDSHFGPGFKIRPPPPPEVGSPCCTCCVHTACLAQWTSGRLPGTNTKIASLKCPVL